MLQPNAFVRRLVIVAILLVAFAFRIARIDEIPPGLSHDEAYNGITAIQALEGQWRVFYEINKGIEPLIIYLEALAFYAFGIGPVQLRLVNVMAGMLTVALVYPLAARLFDHRVALLAMGGLAISFWAIFVSRLTLRAVLLPLLLLLMLYLLWRALTAQPGRQAPTETSIVKPYVILAFFALSGVAAGVTMYTYLSARFVPLIVLTLFGYFLLNREITRWHWLGLVLHIVLWAVIFSPLATYFIENFESFTRRSNQVTTIPHALNGEFEPMIRNTLRTLGMFTFRGDTTDRYNLDGRPVFDWINGLLFYFGVGLLVWRLFRAPTRSAPAVLLLSTTVFMLLPDFVTDDSPHFLRTIGALPMVYVFWAIGLDKFRSIHQPTLIFLVFAILLLHTTYDYFIRWANAPEARHIYGADIAEVAEYLKSVEAWELPAISAEYYRDLDPFRFNLHFHGHPPFVIWFDGTQSMAVPPLDSSLSPRYIFPASAPAADVWTLLLERLPEESGQEYNLYQLQAGSSLTKFQDRLDPVNVSINDDLILLGYQVLGEVKQGGKVQVLLGWRALRRLPPGTDYTFQVQLRDSQGHIWLETDANGYDPDDWQPGILGLQLLTLRLPGDLPTGRFELIAQVIDRQTQQALKSSTDDTVISLGTVVATR